MAHSLTDSDRALQRAQFQQLAIKALEVYGLAASHIEFISDSLNTVFQVVAQGAKYALRIHPAENHSPEAIQAELLWLSALRRDTGLIVPEPLPAQDGRLVQVVSLPGLLSPRPVVVFKWVEGELLDKDLSPDTLALAGAFMASPTPISISGITCCTRARFAPLTLTIANMPRISMTWRCRSHTWISAKIMSASRTAF